MGLVENAKSFVGITSDPIEIARKRLATARADLDVMEKEGDRVRAQLVSEGESDYEAGRAITGLQPWEEINHRIRVLRGVVDKREKESAEVVARDREQRISAAWKRLLARREALKPRKAVALAVAALARRWSRESGYDTHVTGLSPSLASWAEAGILGGSDAEVDQAAGELRALGVEPSLNPPFGLAHIPIPEVDEMAMGLVATIEKSICKSTSADFLEVRKHLVDPQIEITRQAQERERERLNFNEQLAKDAKRMGARTAQEVAADDGLFQEAHDLLRSCILRGIPCQALTNVCAASYNSRHDHGIPTNLAAGSVMATRTVDAFGPMPS